MRIRKEISVKTEKLSSGFSAAMAVCRALAQSPDRADVLDFSRVSFVTPAFIVPLVVYIAKYGKPVTFEGMSDYMRNIGFDRLGVGSSDLSLPDFSAFMEKYSRKTYIPLVKFPAARDRLEDKDCILTTIERILSKQSKLPGNIVIGIKYMIAELVDNITEHSHSPVGYVMAQCYPFQGFVDICIGDVGVTLLGSYRNVRDCEIETDAEAMRAVNSGISAKNLPDAENRGYGIKTSKRMLVDGMKGQYMMISGGTVYGKTPEADLYLDIPGGLRYSGTIVALRVPYATNKDFNYLRYIE